MSPHLDSQLLLEPISAESPCGENLEDTPLLTGFDSYRVFGRRTPVDAPADPARKEDKGPPDWREVKARATEALARSKDLRLLAFLGSAVLRTDDLIAFADTLTVASAWLDRYWKTVYPLITEDAIARRSALNCFADPNAILDRLRWLPLVTSREHGVFMLRDLDQPTSAAKARVDDSRIAAALGAMPLDDLAALHGSVIAALDALGRIEGRMRELAGSEAAPDFETLTVPLGKLQGVLAPALESRQARGEAVAPVPGAPAAVAAAPTAAVGVIQSREDAVRALDAVAEFFRRTEPSSPVPIFLARAKRLVAMTFLELLADIAPDAVEKARAAGGVKQGE